ncbi:MAG: hypothetical protein ACYC61_08620 [Isosphaeraceae bacterium]
MEIEMRRSQQPEIPPETKLGLLAMQFRSTRDESVRDKVASDYARIVNELIAGGQWEEMPAFEDMLPDDRMPKAFFKHWSIPIPCSPDGCR